MKLNLPNLERIKNIFRTWLNLSSPIEKKEGQLRWTKARLSVLKLKDFGDFKGWLESLQFDYFTLALRAGKDREQFIENVSKVELLEFIVSEIERSETMAEVGEKEIARLTGKSKR